MEEEREWVGVGVCMRSSEIEAGREWASDGIGVRRMRSSELEAALESGVCIHSSTDDESIGTSEMGEQG